MIDDWYAEWRSRVAGEGRDDAARQNAMLAVNPAYIPRNHLVENVIRAALKDGDLAPFEQLLDVLAEPFNERAGLEPYMRPPEPHEAVYQTFCGT